MNTTILRNTTEVYAASLETLNHTYRELRGLPHHPGFEDIDAARPAVANAIMAAENVVAQAGIPRGTRAVAKTVAELGYNPYAPGTISHALQEAINQQQPITPRPRRSELKEPSDMPKRNTINRVRATGAGTSRVNATSIRGAVLAEIARRNIATVAELEEHFGHPVRGYLQKLLEKGHIEVLAAEAA